MRTSILIAALLFLACARGTTLEIDVAGTSVELDAYSGRPNPVWQLTRAEADQLRARLTDLSPAKGSLPDQLGYRGFILRDGSGAEIRVYQGLVFSSGKVYEGHSAESWLIEYAQQRGEVVPR